MKSFYHGEINEFIDWHDTDGNIINASDGGIIFANGKYHWYGMAFRNLPFLSGNVEKLWDFCAQLKILADSQKNMI